MNKSEDPGYVCWERTRVPADDSAVVLLVRHSLRQSSRLDTQRPHSQILATTSGTAAPIRPTHIISVFYYSILQQCEHFNGLLTSDMRVLGAHEALRPYQSLPGEKKFACRATTM